MWKFVKKILDFILPPRCIGCQEIVTTQGTLCGACWAKIDFIEHPMCCKCGNPFTVDMGQSEQCGACLKTPPTYSKARSAVVYNDGSRTYAIRFKHGDATYLAPLMAQWMYKCAPDLIEGSDLIVPVPLHWTRLIMRRYNQAALLAKELSKISGNHADNQILKRTKATRSQKGKKDQRRKNVRKVFTTNANLNGKKILLVDDVLTTGATVDECSKTLIYAGASEVRVLTFAKVCFEN